MRNVLIIGAGGVGAATAHKCAQQAGELGDICVAARTVAKCERVVAEIREAGSLREPGARLSAATLDAMDADAVAALIARTGSDIVLNVASPYCNLSIIEACLASGAHYLDTAVHEQEGELNEPAPWYARNMRQEVTQEFREARTAAVRAGHQ